METLCSNGVRIRVKHLKGNRFFVGGLKRNISDERLFNKLISGFGAITNIKCKTTDKNLQFCEFEIKSDTRARLIKEFLRELQNRK